MHTRLEADRCSFTNEPVEWSTDIYENARGQMRSFVEARSDVEALYEYGTVHAPGISDIDFMLVISPSPQSDISEYFSPKNIPLLVQEVMNTGTMMVMKTTDFVQLSRWEEITVRLVEGKSLELLEIGDEERHWTDICSVIDWIPERCSRLVEIFVSQVIPVRRSIAYLFSLTYSLKLLEHLSHSSHANWDDFIAEVELMRSSWFQNDRESMHERLIELLWRGLNLSLEALMEFGEYCVSRGYYSSVSFNGPKSLNLGSDRRLDFVDNSDVYPDYALSQSEPALIVVPVPALFYNHFAVYGLVGGMIGSTLAQHLTPRPRKDAMCGMPNLLVDVLTKRVQHCNSMAEFLHRNSFRSGMYRLGWFYLPQHSNG